jgi:hypothetical protein
MKAILIIFVISVVLAAHGVNAQSGNNKLGSSGIILPAPTPSETKIKLFCPNGNSFFVLYYGNPLEDKSDGKTVDGERIRDLKPNFVVLAEDLYNQPTVPGFFHFDKDGKSTEIRVLTYIATGYGNGNLKKLFARIEDAMSANYDGVFFDEVEDEATSESPNQSALVEYYSSLGKKVKSYGNDNLVIFNPGEKTIQAWLFNWADIVSVENNGIKEGLFDKPHGTVSGVVFPVWRWLAIQGDPSEYAAKDLKEAGDRLKSFRKNKGLWFYSPPFKDTDKNKSESSHWILPDWLEKFAGDAKKESVSCSQ